MIGRFGVLMLLILISCVSASCDNNQININEASKEELTNIIYIGAVRAEQLIDLRPFKSIDDLLDIKGIGEVTLDKIKDQGLACVGEEKKKKEKSKEEIKEKEEEVKEMETVKKEKVELVTLRLNPQIIKSEESTENSYKDTYIKYGFIGFCILLGSLFILKKKSYKNEFR